MTAETGSPTRTARPPVVVLLGGPSAEHDVSIVSGTATDVRRLAERVHAAILERDGVDLRFEIEFVGDWTGWEAEP
jgi:hypothetical protein